jgi:thiosulfate sulfurtransferase
MGTTLPFKHISVTDTDLMIHETDVQLVDIRDEHAFEQAHIPGAFHLGNHNIQDYIREADLDKPLIVYCYHGNSSQPAAAYLHEQGFEEVYSMDGGFEAWRVKQQN